MNIHYLQHVPFEGVGSIKDWVDAHGHRLSVTRLYQEKSYPSLDEFELLIAMGGPMGVYDEKQYPWLVEEKTFLERAISAGKPVIGICLGVQLLANVLGAKVYPNPQKEIGWFPIQLTPEGERLQMLKGFPVEPNVFHWHGDTFDLPDGAIWAAQSRMCKHQAFVYDERIIGLQFHLETTRKSAELLIENCRHELVDAPHIQAAEAMMADEQRFTQIDIYMQGILEHITTRVEN